MSRPEHSNPPEIYYNDTESRKYSGNSRVMAIQNAMADRALELLCLPPDMPCLLMDIGCGSGLSGDVLSEYGHEWVGIDISESMLNVAVEREVEGDLFVGDMGQGVFFRPGVFDGCISISALQWLCNADKSSHNPKKRLMTFFQTLFNSLVRGGRAVFQFYPEDKNQVSLITSCALNCGFTGGIVVDYPNSTKAKKFFLCLFAGEGDGTYQPQARGAESEEQRQANYTSFQRRARESKGIQKKSRDWIMAKKESQRRKGDAVRLDTKYTGRKRSTPRF